MKPLLPPQGSRPEAKSRGGTLVARAYLQFKYAVSILEKKEENKSRSRHNVEGSFLCVLYFGWPNQPSSGITGLYLKKAGLASRNIVHTKKILLRCVDFCFYFLHFICEAD